MAGKKKDREVIGGYIVPTRASGAAVRMACELIVAEPGIRQSDLLNKVVYYVGLNHGTAGWIVTPGQKSPAGNLWIRRYEDRSYHCYPNEHTPACKGSVETMIKEWEKMPVHCDWEVASTMKIGDLAIWNGDSSAAVFLGWTHSETSEVFPSMLEAACDGQRVHCEKWNNNFKFKSPYPLWLVNGRLLKWGEHFHESLIPGFVKA